MLLADLRRSMEGLDRICFYFEGVHGVYVSTSFGGGILFNGRFEHERWSAFSIRFNEAGSDVEPPGGDLESLRLHQKDGKYVDWKPKDHGSVWDFLKLSGLSRSVNQGKPWFDRIGVTGNHDIIS